MYEVLENDDMDPGFTVDTYGWYVVVESETGIPVAMFLHYDDAARFAEES